MTRSTLQSQHEITWYAREALTQLLKAGLSVPLKRLQLTAPSRYEANGPKEKAQASALKRLIRSGIVARHDPIDDRKGVHYALVDGKHVAAQEALASPEILSEALWPGSGALTFTAADIEDKDTSVPFEEEALGVLSGSAPPDDTAQVLLATLKTIKTLGDAVAELQTTVAALKKGDRISYEAFIELGGETATLHAKVDRLIVAQAPRLGEWDAKQLAIGERLHYHVANGVEVVHVVSVRTEIGRPVIVTVARGPLNQQLELTPKSLSRIAS